MCEALWEELRRALEDHVVACLYQLPVTDESVVMRQSRSDYMDQLHLLISTRQLCQQYRCVLDILCGLDCLGGGGSHTFSELDWDLGVGQILVGYDAFCPSDIVCATTCLPFRTFLLELFDAARDALSIKHDLPI